MLARLPRCAAIVAAVLLAANANALTGFSEEDSAQERAYESAFQALVSADACRGQSRRLTEDTHVAGTAASLAVADYIASEYASYGLTVTPYDYEVYLPFPEDVSVTLVSPAPAYEVVGREEPWAWDKDSFGEVIAGYNAYAPDGDVTAQLVYVNRGLPEDYDALAEMGVSVAGKVCIARYGESYRGVKAHVAGERGAAALLLYSDPADDGYMQGDVYPRGPQRPGDAIQRGTVKYIFVHASDPLTPGWASTPNADRLTRDEATDLPDIPVVPLSYNDAEPLLQAIAGPNVPDGWQGGLPFAYHVGPGPATVHVRVVSDHANRPIRNVIAMLPGTEYPDEWVILGNHHDAWTYGAADPSSGTAALLEVARCLGLLAEDGLAPKRTIVFASWDAEEFGILGSTEWAEDLADELQAKAVAYLNVDIAATGPSFGASAVPTLKRLIREVTRDVIAPATLGSIHDAWACRQDADEPRIGSLGSGSDHSPFLGHLGIASMSMGFHGPYGVYHAMQDNFYWMENFGDPGFRYHAAMAKLWGLIALRLANAEALPFDYAAYASELLEATDALDEDHPAALDEHAGITALRDALTRWATAADAIDDDAAPADIHLLERLLTSDAGLPRRPWFRHLIYAPGWRTGYAAVVFPGVRDALDAGDTAQLDSQLDILARACGRVADALEAATE
ncbi:M28 family peptidase [Candidatus Poribacteria bacterium]|nr:M28 family peptidase [Candidatus Poribacteria bacterium]